MHVKPRLSPQDLVRYLNDSAAKSDSSARTHEVLTDVVAHSSAILAGADDKLRVGAFFEDLYVVLTEVEAMHRNMLKTCTSVGASATLTEWVRNTVTAHDALRNTLSDSDLLWIEAKRHAKAHLRVDAHRIQLNDRGLVDSRRVAILHSRVVTIAEQDRLLAVAGGDAGTLNRIASRARVLVDALAAVSAPLRTPRDFDVERLAVVTTARGTWGGLARFLCVDEAALLAANRKSANDEVGAGTIVLIPRALQA